MNGGVYGVETNHLSHVPGNVCRQTHVLFQRRRDVEAFAACLTNMKKVPSSVKSSE